MRSCAEQQHKRGPAHQGLLIADALEQRHHYSGRQQKYSGVKRRIEPVGETPREKQENHPGHAPDEVRQLDHRQRTKSLMNASRLLSAGSTPEKMRIVPAANVTAARARGTSPGSQVPAAWATLAIAALRDRSS